VTGRRVSTGGDPTRWGSPIHIVGRNRLHRVPTKTASKQPMASIDRAKLCGSSKLFTVTHASEPEKMVPDLRGLMLDPEVLLLDEPLGSLDPLVRAELQEDLAEVFRSLGKSVVMVTHDLAEAAFFGHEIVLLRDGRIVQRGVLEDLLNAPADPFVIRFTRAQRRFDGGPL
jgi:ABC-type proline/glycine betaine transport system ATPase subunit